MPFANIYIAPSSGRPVDTGAVARMVTDRLVEDLRKNRSLTVARVELSPTAPWTVGGERIPTDHSLFFVRALVSAGSNTLEEKANFVRSVYLHLSRHLGPTSELSYIVVDEVPRVDWGYGGRTQEDRAMS